MEVIIRPTAPEAAQLVARIVGHELQANPRLVIGLAPGRTMEMVYALLVRMHQESGLDFSLCRTVAHAEFIGLGSDDPHSCRRYLDERFFRKINIDPRNTHLPDGRTADWDAECARYEQLVAKLGGVDLHLLGISRTSHLGFNEPLSALRSRTRVKALSPATRAAHAWFFARPDLVPERAITMGVGTILEGRRCVMLATGTEKADIIAQAVEGPITSMNSATALQLHPRCTVIVDEAAAAQLQGAEHYRWIFANEPDWEPYRSSEPAG
jgi:glucosamine-6-phosphate deaminase